MTAIAGQTIWITGASSGIGEALAYELNRQGARLLLSARRTEELERVKSQCPHPEQVQLLPIDLAKADTLAGKAEEALSLGGRVHIVVHNGGISQRSLARETELSVDRQLMAVNYFGTIALTKAILPHFLEQGGGHFVVVSSLVGKFGSPYRSSYAASKHALHGYFDSLRAEENQNDIRVSIVCPGFIRTQISMNALTADGSKLGEMDEAQAKGLSPESCARAIAKAIKENKDELYVGGKEVGGVYLHRFLPGLFRKFIGKVKVR